MASTGIVVGLLAGIVVAVVVIICCIRSIFKDQKNVVRQIKQVRGVNDMDLDDIEASVPPSEEHATDLKEYELSQQHQQHQQQPLGEHGNNGFADGQSKQPMEADGS